MAATCHILWNSYLKSGIKLHKTGQNQGFLGWLVCQMYKEFIGMICEFVSARPKWRWRLFEIFYKIFTWNLLCHVKEFENGDKTLVTTHHSKAVSNKSSFNTDDLGPCSHEEADYRMMLHVADMVKQNITKNQNYQ